MQETSKSNRIEWIDALKGYAICMMMFSHMEFSPDAVKNFISPIFLAAFLSLPDIRSMRIRTSFVDLFLQIRGQNDGLWFFPFLLRQKSQS